MNLLKTTIPLIALPILLCACAAHKNAAHLPTTKLVTLEDTIHYLQTNLIDQKSKYVNKPLSVLLRDNKVPFKSFISMSDMDARKQSSKTDVYFEDTQTNLRHNSRYEKKPWLRIFWEEPLVLDTVINLARRHYGNWEEEVNTYFSNRIVKDILLYY